MAEEEEQEQQEQMEAPKKRTHAKDFGDDPKIRHSHGEHTKTSKEPWELKYRHDRMMGKRAPRKTAKDFGDVPWKEQKTGRSVEIRKRNKSEPWEKKRAPGSVDRDFIFTAIGTLALIGFGLGLKSGMFKQ